MSLSPVLAEMATYPFVRLDAAKGEARARGIELIDFGMGDPREETDPLIRRALVDALEPVSSYPRATGLPELREAIADWCRRRFGAELDPEQEIVPTLGSKEAIFSFAQVVVDPGSDRRLVVAPEPGYPVYERGAAFAGAEARFVPLLEENRFLPDLDSFDDWEHVAVFWLNYPNNPTGATAPLELYERLAALATEYGFYVASDEAYSELWFDEPPASALQVAQRERVVVFNTLSKRSSMTGYRSGFVAAAPHLADALRKFRPTVGTAPQEFVQRASVVAWGDEQHVERTRQLYRRKREALVPALVAAGLRIAASEATFYLWVEAPGGDSEAFAEELMQRGIVVAPGSYFGAAGEGYVRFALVPSQAECERAAEVIRAL
jgi:succinyldiaminopimelate transaminase